MRTLSLLVGDHVKDANSLKSKPSKKKRLFLEAVEKITRDHFATIDWTVNPGTPEAHTGLAACLRWKNDGPKKLLIDRKKRGLPLSRPHCLFLSALRNVLMHGNEGDKVRPQSVLRSIVMRAPPSIWTELLRKLRENEDFNALVVETV